MADSGQRELGELVRHGYGRWTARNAVADRVGGEVTTFLGQGPLQARPGRQPGHRKSPRPIMVKTLSRAAGAAAPEAARHRPAVRVGAAGHPGDPQQPVEALGIAGFIWGLSTRDVQATLTEALGAGAVSRSTVSRICEQIAGEFTAWSTRSLARWSWTTGTWT